MGIIYIAIGAVCIYMLQAVVYRKFWNKNLTMKIEFMQHAMIEKEPGELSETIVNQKCLPLPMLRVKFEADRHLDFGQEGNVSVTDRCYKNDIFTVMMYQKIIRKIKFYAKRRGYYTIKQIFMDSTDLFMESHLGMEMACDAYIYVYPRHVNTRRLFIPFQKMMGDLLTRRYTYEDPFEFQGIRPYEPFDRMRDVNWKATARTGELRTNLHGHTVRQEVCILLNLESETMMEYKELKEESIRIANSLAEMFLEQGIPVGMQSNAKDILSGKTMHITSGAGGGHLISLRESLARLDLSQTMEEFADYLEKNLSHQTADILYILISASQREQVMQAFRKISAGSISSFWIVPLHPWMEQKVQSVKSMSIIRWEVEQDAER